MTTVDPRQLQTLFESFTRRDEEKFVRTAEAIIERELSANHHGYANTLRQALQSERSELSTPSPFKLTPIPKDRRSGEDLLWISEPRSGLDNLVLHTATRDGLTRFLLEQRGQAKLRAHGLRPKNRLLFWGSPGNGKTAAASAIGFELGLPVAAVRLDSLISSFLGDTASHLNRIFARATSTPLVLFLDEADAIGKRRDDPKDVGELKRIVNALLQQIDRLQGSESIFIAASNHQYLFDPALWRRFDSIIEFPRPRQRERKELLRRVLRDIKLAGSLDAATKASEGMSFSEIEMASLEALKTMVLNDKPHLSAADLTEELRSARTQRFRASQGPGKDDEQ